MMFQPTKDKFKFLIIIIKIINAKISRCLQFMLRQQREMHFKECSVPCYDHPDPAAHSHPKADAARRRKIGVSTDVGPFVLSPQMSRIRFLARQRVQKRPTTSPVMLQALHFERLRPL
jgi:hypothetical protein